MDESRSLADCEIPRYDLNLRYLGHREKIPSLTMSEAQDCILDLKSKSQCDIEFEIRRPDGTLVSATGGCWSR